MSKVVGTLFVVGLLINTLKGADLILRPHQQRWLQDKLDSLTLRLEYTRPLQWYARVAGLKVQIVLTALSATLQVTLLLTIASFYGRVPWWAILIMLVFVPLITFSMFQDEAFNWYDKRHYSPEELRQLERLSGNYSDRYRHGRLSSGEQRRYIRQQIRNLRKWVFGGSTIFQYFTRPLLIIVLALTCYAALYAAFTYLHWFQDLHKSGRSFSRIKLGFILALALLALQVMKPQFVIPALIDFGVLAILSCVVLLSSLILLVLEMLLKIVRGLVWRVVEYNKGAFAAIVLILTILLGVIESYVKFR